MEACEKRQHKNIQSHPINALSLCVSPMTQLFWFSLKISFVGFTEDLRTWIFSGSMYLFLCVSVRVSFGPHGKERNTPSPLLR